MFDIAQAAIGMDGSGPCEFIPKGYNGTEYLTMKYRNGIVMTEQDFRKEGGQGICFNGDKGWLKVARGYIECSDPQLISKKEKKIAAGEYEKSPGHMQNFIDSIRSRKDPIAPVESGCSTNTLCCIANIATELERPVKWDPATLSFGDDDEAKTTGYTSILTGGPILYKTESILYFIMLNNIKKQIRTVFMLFVLACSTLSFASAQDSKTGNVQIGTITYSYREMQDQSLPAILDYIVASGINTVELMGGTVENYAGIPSQGQKEWRTSVSMDKFREIKKMFDDKGVKIHNIET